MRLVDADSQFTCLVDPKGSDLSFSSPERVRALVAAGTICFGHKVFGSQHDLFVVMLRMFQDAQRDEVVAQIKLECEEWFGLPDVILYPGESTAAYLVSHIAEALAPSKPPPTILLNPAFRAYGKAEVRLEIARTNDILGKTPCNVLFFDDSLSSGETEVQAIAALGDLVDLKAVKWLSYVVLRRGDRPADDTLPERRSPILSSDKYRFRAYCPIGPVTLSEATCPLCPASHRLRVAQELTSRSRPEIAKALGKALDWIQPGQLEQISPESSLLSTEVTADLLYLCGLPLQEVCYFLAGRDCPSDERALACALFVCIHYTDVSSYVSQVRLALIVERQIVRLRDDDNFQCGILLFCIAMLPTSFVQANCVNWQAYLVRANSPSAASSVHALVLAGNFQAFSSFGKYNCAFKLATRRQAELVSYIRLALRDLRRCDDLTVRQAVDIVDLDLNVLASVTSDGIVQVARALSVLLEEGRHEFFLHQKLKRLDTSTLGSLLTDLDHVLNLLHELSQLASAHLEGDIALVKRQLAAAAESRNVVLFGDVATDSLRRLWKGSALRELFYTPDNLRQWAHQAMTAVKFRTAEHSLPKEFFTIRSQAHELRSWCCFGPPAEHMREHLHNIFNNPVDHFEHCRHTVDLAYLCSLPQFTQPKPLLICFFARSADHLLIVAADRATPADSKRLFTSSGGLANARAQFAFYGGSVDHELGIALSDDLRELAERESIDTEVYRNFFVTRIPLTVETRYTL